MKKIYLDSYSVRLKERIRDTFGYEYIEQKKSELCLNCSRFQKYSTCHLLPVNTDGSFCYYYDPVGVCAK